MHYTMYDSKGKKFSFTPDTLGFILESMEYLDDCAFGSYPIDVDHKRYEGTWIADLPNRCSLHDVELDGRNMWQVIPAEVSEEMGNNLKRYRNVLRSIQSVLPDEVKMLEKEEVQYEDIVAEKSGPRKGKHKLVKQEECDLFMHYVLQDFFEDNPHFDEPADINWDEFFELAQGSAIRILDRIISLCEAGEIYLKMTLIRSYD